MAFSDEFKSGQRVSKGRPQPGRNIFTCARCDTPEFRTQIRWTLLDEVGRYLGLGRDEADQSEL